MHTLRNRMLFFGSTALAGLSSLALHRYMMDNCFDAKGLLIAGNLPGMLLVAVGVVFGVCLLLMLRTVGGDGEYADNFPRDLLSGALLVAAGAVMAWAVPRLGQATEPVAQELAGTWVGTMDRITHACMTALPWLAAASMAVLGLLRMAGRKSSLCFGAVICLYYMLTLVSDYRLWSADPQIQDYAYQLLSGVLLMLCSFHRTCCDAGIIQRRKLIFTGLAASVCCMASLSMDFQRPFYLASALWAAGCVCNVAVLPPDPEPEEAVPENGEGAEQPESPGAADGI